MSEKLVSQSGRTALVAGASGLVGQCLVAQLLQSPNYRQIKVLTRRPLPLQPQARLVTLERPAADFGKLDAATLKAEVVFCCLGTRQGDYERVDFQLVVDIATAAYAAGAETFVVVSALGASEHSPFQYFRLKARMEAAVSALGYQAVHVVRPSLLLGHRQHASAGESLVFGAVKALSPLMRGPLRKARPVKAQDVATSMIELASSGIRGTGIHHLPLE